MSAYGSIVVRRQLGRELRLARELSRRTLDDVAAAQIASISKLHRIEHGRTSVRSGDVRELCRLYGVSEDTTETLATLAHATRDPDWWERHDTSAPSWFALYLSLETVASELYAFEPAVVHGLFQTREYAREVERCSSLDGGAEQIERYVLTRALRQRQAFDRPDPLVARLVLGEAALVTQVGSAEVMAAQLDHLRRLARRPHLDIRVLPFSAGQHPGLRGSFSLLAFPDPDDPPVTYVETYEAARYPESPAQVARFRQRFARIWALSVPVEEQLRER